MFARMPGMPGMPPACVVFSVGLSLHVRSVVYRFFHVFLVRLPSILLGYSDFFGHDMSRAWQRHLRLHLLSTTSPFQRRRNVTELRRPTRDIFLLFCRVVLEQRVSRHRCAEGSWPCAAPNTTRVALCALPEPLQTLLSRLRSTRANCWKHAINESDTWGLFFCAWGQTFSS